MKNKENRKLETGFSLSQPSSSDLRGRQSVRATFKLTEKSIEAISILSVHLGIKQKSLFDHLIEDIDSLNFIAQEARPEPPESDIRIQKTYVLSRKTLSNLDRISRVFHTPRDALVEKSIRRLWPLITKEREKHRLRKEILGEFKNYLDQWEELSKKSKETLGEDDPLSDRIEAALIVLTNTYEYLDSFIKRCEVIEDF